MKVADTSPGRLTAVYAVLFVVGTAILCTCVYVTASGALDRSIAQRILGDSAALAIQVEQAGIAAIESASTRGLEAGGPMRAMLLVDRDGRRLAGNIGAWPAGVTLAASDVVERLIDVGAAGETRLRTVRLTVRTLEDGRRLLFGEDMAERQRYATVFRTTAIWAGLLLGALGAAIVYAFAQRFGTRVANAAGACERVMGGQLGERLPVAGLDDPVDRLAKAVNLMLDRLQQLTNSRRTVFDTAAHDLRGPLYRLRNRIESELRRSQRGLPVGGLDEALRDIDGLQRTLVMLLEIARAESGEPLLDVVRFDLAALVRDVVELYSPVARAESLSLVPRARVPVAIDGNRHLVGQLVSNLVENAIKYVPAGGTIVVSATRGERGVKLVVSDDGPGIPEAARQRASQPFVRLEGSEGAQGSGLGLSLVSAIARLHGAAFVLEDNAPGLRVEVEFAPASAAAHSSPAG